MPRESRWASPTPTATEAQTPTIGQMKRYTVYRSDKRNQEAIALLVFPAGCTI
jgi:hypothetical protein